MRKIFVLLLDLLVAIPAVSAGGNSPERRASISSPDKPLHGEATAASRKGKFDKNGVYVSPSGYVFRAGKGGTVRLREPIQKETPPSFLDMRRVGRNGLGEVWEDTRNGRTYICNESGCR